MHGLVSRVESGCAKGGADRQWWYLNGRCVELKRLTRVLNEIYRTFNPSQYPAFALCLTLPQATCDVNISPDKREVMLHDERLIIPRLRVSDLS